MNNNEKLRAMNLQHKESHYDKSAGAYRVVNRMPRHESVMQEAEITEMSKPLSLWICWAVIIISLCVFSFVAGMTIGSRWGL